MTPDETKLDLMKRQVSALERIAHALEVYYIGHDTVSDPDLPELPKPAQANIWGMPVIPWGGSSPNSSHLP